VAYVSLYRRYRPQSFADVVGQAHVTRTLVHAIDEGRLHHAYLFTGPRGTGKTSTARILAKAINCDEGPTSSPCNVCEHCRAITEGSSMDVIELDMASHGGVDDARELRDRALFAPASSRRKVYILDEVHMASTAAFNALLKLIEEPPEHVLFAMATTDPQKVLPTILSRVQRLDLRRVPAAEVAPYVQRICDDEGYTIAPDAVEAVVRAGDGSVRDTLSVLEQVLAYAGSEVSADAVAQVLGQTPAERVIETVELLGARDLAGLLGMVQGLLDQGHDLRRFTLDLVQHLRDLLVLQVAPDRPDLVDTTAERRERLQDQTAVLPRESLLRAVELLAATVAEQRQGSPRLPLELALAKLAVPGGDGDLSALADRIGRLEAGTAPSAPRSAYAREDPGATVAADPGAKVTGAPSASPSGVEPADGRATGTERSASDGPAPAVATDDLEVTLTVDDPAGSAASGAASDADPGHEDELARVEGQWDAILDLVKRRSRRCHAVFEPAVPAALGRGIVTLRYPKRYASFHAQNAGRSEYADVLRDAIERACGLSVKVEVTVEGDDTRRRPVPPSMTPDDARTPVLDQEDDGPSADEEIEVREAEQADSAGRPATDPEGLIASELGAELIDERPPPGATG
jgi:DNA polymerase III subunit gamma/tau